MSYFVEDPIVQWVRDVETGLERHVSDYQRMDYWPLNKLRGRLSTEKVSGRCHLVCAVCGIELTLGSIKDFDGNPHRFHFIHGHDPDNCPQQNYSRLTKEQIDALKYAGVPESAAHKEAKAWLEASLVADPDFSLIAQEKIIQAPGNPRRWRKPDVQALWRNKLKVVFEVQLSTTYLHVITERRLFYQEHNILLVWVFRGVRNENPLMTQEDIFYTNNRNVFVVSEETVIASRKARQLMLECHWSDSSREATHRNWNSAQVPFADLHKEVERPEGQRVYFRDCEAVEARAARERQIAAIKPAYVDDEQYAFQQEFEAWWCDGERYKSAQDWDWFKLRFTDELHDRNIQVPFIGTKLERTLNAIYCAKAGKPVNSNQPTLLCEANYVVDNAPYALQSFLLALGVYKQAKTLWSQDPKKKFRKKYLALKQAKQDSPETAELYSRIKAFDEFINYLFPELYARLRQADQEA